MRLAAQNESIVQMWTEGGRVGENTIRNKVNSIRCVSAHSCLSPTTRNVVVYGLLMQHMAFDCVRSALWISSSKWNKESLTPSRSEYDAKIERFDFRRNQSVQSAFRTTCICQYSLQPQYPTQYLLFINFWKYVRLPYNGCALGDVRLKNEKNEIRRRDRFARSSRVPRRKTKWRTTERKRFSFSINVEQTAHWIFVHRSFFLLLFSSRHT